ncbi:MAG: glycosyltransferase, partial [Phycisphaerae bacterium]
MVSEALNVISVSTTYPTADWPARGNFVRRRLEAMAARMNLRVIAPRPWFPLLRRPPGGRARDERLAPRQPRVFYLPGILPNPDPWMFGRALLRDIRAMQPEFQPDLLDAHFVWPDGVAVAWVARRLKLPYVITIRGKIVSHTRDARRRALIRDMLRRAAARIAVSRDLARRAAALAADQRPVHVIPNGVDTSCFRPMDRAAAREALGLHPAARYLISVGYVQELKGFDRVVAVLPELRARCGDVRLLLVGNDVGEREFARRLDRLIETSGMRDAVTHVRGAAAADIARYLNAADVFVLATRAEGWCNAIHESLACGTPVVATDVGGNRELVSSPA